MTPEGLVSKQIQSYLTSRDHWWIRMNVGAFKTAGGGFMRCGKPGQADLLCYSQRGLYWIEVKGPKGKQSELQKAFEDEVKDRGMVYILARSVHDVMAYGL